MRQPLGCAGTGVVEQATLHAVASPRSGRLVVVVEKSHFSRGRVTCFCKLRQRHPFFLVFVQSMSCDVECPGSPDSILAPCSAVVSEHETRKEALPSVIEVCQFSSSHKQPCLADFNDLWAQHLVATQMCDKIMRHGECCAFVIDIDVEPLEYMFECRKQIHQAIYRILVAGATVSGLYNAPSYTSDPIDPSDDELSDEQQEALMSFPAFCMRSDPEEDDSMFGAFTRWLRDDILTDIEAREALAQRHKSKTGRGLCCWYNNPAKDDLYYARFGYERTEPRRCALVDVDELSHSDIHLIGWRVMQMLHVHDLVLTIVKRFRSPSPPPGAPTAYRTIPIVFLGEFARMRCISPESNLSLYTWSSALLRIAAIQSTTRKSTEAIGTGLLLGLATILGSQTPTLKRRR